MGNSAAAGAQGGAARVIVVHGLWMNGLETTLLRQRLAAEGFSPQVFRYPSTQTDLGVVTASLAEFITAQGPGVHLVGHSLGGLIVLETLQSRPELRVGRAVLLGSPVRGSSVARTLAAWPAGRALLGSLASVELARHHQRRWQGPGELGVIAGTLAAGLGRIVTHLPGPSDGTVSVEETHIEGASAQLLLEVSHTGMLFSSAVASATAGFLRQGHFAAH